MINGKCNADRHRYCCKWQWFAYLIFISFCRILFWPLNNLNNFIVELIKVTEWWRGAVQIRFSFASSLLQVTCICLVSFVNIHGQSNLLPIFNAKLANFSIDNRQIQYRLSGIVLHIAALEHWEFTLRIKEIWQILAVRMDWIVCAQYASNPIRALFPRSQ